MAIQPLESIAVIPDGNRRYAKRKGLSLEAAYLAGFKKSGELLKWSYLQKSLPVQL